MIEAATVRLLRFPANGHQGPYTITEHRVLDAAEFLRIRRERDGKWWRLELIDEVQMLTIDMAAVQCRRLVDLVLEGRPPPG